MVDECLRCGAHIPIWRDMCPCLGADGPLTDAEITRLDRRYEAVKAQYGR